MAVSLMLKKNLLSAKMLFTFTERYFTNCWFCAKHSLAALKTQTFKPNYLVKTMFNIKQTNTTCPHKGHFQNNKLVIYYCFQNPAITGFFFNLTLAIKTFIWRGFAVSQP